MKHIPIAMILLGLMLLAPRAFGQTTPRYYDQQLLNYRYSEFCSVVGKPSQMLAEAINGALAQNPTDPKWRREAEWFNRIVEQYAKARCGDA